MDSKIMKGTATMKPWIAFAAAIAFLPLRGSGPLPPIPSGRAAANEPAKETRDLREFPVRLKGNSISAGNKTLEINSNGSLCLTADGQELAQFYCFFKGKNSKTGKNVWAPVGGRNIYDANQSLFRREDHSFIYEGTLKISGISWKQFRQQVTLLPSGLVRVEYEYFPSPVPSLTVELHSFWITLPRELAENHQFTLSGKTVRFDPRREGVFLASGKEQTPRLTLCADVPDQQFSITGTQGKDFEKISCLPVGKQLRISLTAPRTQRKGAFLIDLRKSVEKRKSGTILGGVDFRKTENLTMPDRSSKNLLRNPSFEQGFHEYWISHPGFDLSAEKWKQKPFEIDHQAPFSGQSSLKIHIFSDRDHDFRSLRKAPNLGSSLIVLEPGVYTCSFYAKADAPGRSLNIWFNRYRSGSRSGVLKDARLTVHPGKEWRRYSFSFQVTLAKPTGLHMNAVSDQKTGAVWIDAIQLEAGSAPTPFETKAVEGHLTTSAPDNFLSADAPIDAKLILSTKPFAKGKAEISVTDFYKEKRFGTTLSFAADSKGRAILELPLNGRLGKGLFMLRTDYTLDSGERCYDQHRFATADFLNGTHRLKHLFSNCYYGGYFAYNNFSSLLDRARKIGMGAETHIDLSDAYIRNEYRRYGIEPLDSQVWTALRKSNSYRTNIGFGIVKYRPYKTPVIGINNPDVLIRDFKLDANGIITPEWLAKFKEAVKTYIRSCPHTRIWRFGNEVFAAYPYEWWSKTNDPQEAAEKLAQLQKVFAEAVREVSPDSLVMQGSPCNMFPAGGIADMDRLLGECRKLGTVFDVIGFHPYRNAPENPDLDSDTRSAFAMLKKNGYPDTTPLYWGEMMHWGPYEIPQWGTKTSSWNGTPRTWPGNTTLSYDMGRTEQRSAAWRARSWLVALKYSSRILSANSGNTNNFALDLYLTPRASQMVSNTLANLLGDSEFRKDIRFAPFVRAYVFEDARKRPVAAVWCHKESVDYGTDDAPLVEADFGNSLESVIDLMNQERDFQPGKLKFPVMGAPLFFRGRTGTLAQMIHALENAVLVTGKNMAPIHLSLRPVTPETCGILLKNYLSTAFHGTLGTLAADIPAGGTIRLEQPFPQKLSAGKVTEVDLPLTLRSRNGAVYPFDNQKFQALTALRVPDNATLSTVDWHSLPRLELTNRIIPGQDQAFRANCRLAWNSAGFFVEITVRDRIFSHRAFPKLKDRWDNDSIQIYFDSLGNARSNLADGYDDDDYDYAVYPDEQGKSAVVYRNRTPDQQLTLGTEAPKDQTLAPDIPVVFRRTDSGYVCRVHFPAKYLLPAVLKKGKVLGVGLMVNNADDPARNYPDRRCGALSNSTVKGADCCNKPKTYPAVLLWEQENPLSRPAFR